MRICLCVFVCGERPKKDTDLLSIENDDDDAHNHIQYLPYCLQIENIFLKYFIRCFFVHMQFFFHKYDVGILFIIVISI